MRNWDLTDETGHCTADQDAEAARSVAKRLDIPFKEVNLVKEYWSEVFTPLIEDYQRGLTPNPDILCNSHIKFNHFHRICLDRFGCDAVATGHYARSSYGEDLEYMNEQENARLLKAMDQIKDQTFFLSQVEQKALRRSMFPVGGLPKDVVKKIAAKEGFADIAKKKESMGICFIGKRKKGFQNFISNYVDNQEGDMVDVDSGETVGRHRGLHQWTLGQGVLLAGQPQRLYVAGKDPQTHTLKVCAGKDHPSLYSEHFFTGPPHWIHKQPDSLRHGDKSLHCEFRFQNTQPLTKCVASIGMTASPAGNYEFMDQKTLVVSSAEPLRAVTPGQFAVFYSGEECLGSAVIDRPGPSLHTMKRPLKIGGKEVR